jgi:mono/diheme cytochrome c family protein
MVAIFGRSMRNSIAFDPYEGPHLPDSNAVAFAASNYPPEPDDVFIGDPAQVREYDLPPMNKALMARGGGVANELTNPLEVDSADMARGEELYNRMCMVCHGPEGYSADAPILPKLPLMAAYNLAEGNAVGFSDGYIYGMIRVGRGNMPGYGHRLDHFDRWRIVSYVRQLQRDAGQTPGASDAEPANPGAGD